MMDDLVEHASPTAHAYLEVFMPLVDQGMDVEEPLCRQAAVYGAGVLAQAGGEAASPAVQPLVHKLVEMVQDEDAYDEERINCTENALSSLIKFVKCRGPLLGGQEGDIMDVVVTRLPIVADEIEARLVHEQFFRGVVDGDVNFIGDGWSKLPQVVLAFSAILVAHMSVVQEGEDPLLNEESLGAVPEVWAAIQAGAPADALNGVVLALAEEQQAVLAELGWA
mmetsp:Transcript_93239/g.226561  ORF Transcript_93239/g.226561 Transcript_93239/m.226561 type:complete len:223 (+) Transcript_93239:58-726(+)